MSGFRSFLAQYIERMRQTEEGLNIGNSVFGCLSGSLVFFVLGIQQYNDVYIWFGFILSFVAIVVPLLSIIGHHSKRVLVAARLLNTTLPAVVVPISILALTVKYIDLGKTIAEHSPSQEYLFIAIGILLLVSYLLWIVDGFVSLKKDMLRKALIALSFDLGLFSLINYWALQSAQNNIYFGYAFIGLAFIVLTSYKFWYVITNLQRALLSFGCPAVWFGLILLIAGSDFSLGLPTSDNNFAIGINTLGIGTIMISTSAIISEARK